MVCDSVFGKQKAACRTSLQHSLCICGFLLLQVHLDTGLYGILTDLRCRIDAQLSMRFLLERHRSGVYFALNFLACVNALEM